MRLAETGAPAVRRGGGARGNAGALYARCGEGGRRTAPSDGCPRSAYHPVCGLDAGPADGSVIAGARVPSARTPIKGLRRRNAPHGGPARIAAGRALRGGGCHGPPGTERPRSHRGLDWDLVAAYMPNTLGSYCARLLDSGAHSDRFLLHTNARGGLRARGGDGPVPCDEPPPARWPGCEPSLRSRLGVFLQPERVRHPSGAASVLEGFGYRERGRNGRADRFNRLAA